MNKLQLDLVHRKLDWNCYSHGRDVILCDSFVKDTLGYIPQKLRIHIIPNKNGNIIIRKKTLLRTNENVEMEIRK